MKTKSSRRLVSILLAAALISGLFAMPVNAAGTITLSGTCHVQDYGDTNGRWDANTGILTLGTRGQSKRVEAITISLTNNTGYAGSLQYRVHVQNDGWQGYKMAGNEAGTRGRSLRLEGIEMELVGELAKHYTVEYAVHIQDYGDSQGFVSDGALAGTTGESKRLEEVKIRIVPRGTGTTTSVNYRVHRQDYGWESKWAVNGQESGTTGQSKRLEGIEIHLTGNQYTGSIEYHTHIQNIGWEQTWAKDGEMSGTQGMSYRLEGIEIRLTGEVANHYDVYYRVHAQDYGWLGWAKNGQMSGTSGMSKRLEAIQIVLVQRNGSAPGNVSGVTSVMSQPAVINGTPTYPSGSTVSPVTTPSTNPAITTTDENSVEYSHQVVGVYDGISFAAAQTCIPYYDQVYTDKGSGSRISRNGISRTEYFGLYVSAEIDPTDVYFKCNGDEGYRDIGNNFQQYIPADDPVVNVSASYCDQESDASWYFSHFSEQRFQYMRSNGFAGFLLIAIKCKGSGVQNLDVFYKGNKVTTISFDIPQSDNYVLPYFTVMDMYTDVSQYKSDMTDLEMISAGCYWIRCHSYSDYTCYGCQTVMSMMTLTRGRIGVYLSCAKTVDGRTVNDYGHFYPVCPKNRNENCGGHRISLVLTDATHYAYIETQGSGIPSGTTDFSVPWNPDKAYTYGLRGYGSIYDNVTWLRDYDTVYEMILGDYGVDLKSFDPYDCSTWY